MAEAPTGAPSTVFDLQGLEGLKDDVVMDPDGGAAHAAPADGQAVPAKVEPPPPVDPAIAAAGPPEGVQTPGDQTADAQPADAQTPEGQVPDPALWAKKYQTPEALEKGYVEAQAALTRSFQERAEDRGRIAQMEATLQQLAPIVQRAMAASDPEMAEQLQVQEALRPMIEEQVKPLQDQFAQQQQQAYESATVEGFYKQHADVQPFSAADQAVMRTMQELDLNVRPDSLEIAYEAAKDPALFRVLRANPTYIDTDEGLAQARVLARIPDPAQVVQGAQQQQVAQQATARQAAFVEGGASGSPVQGAPGPKPNDVWREAVDAFRNANAGSAFGV